MNNVSDYDSIVSRVGEIPTLPMVAAKVNELLNDPKSNSSEIANVIRQDQALTIKVLRLINSPYYGIPGGVSDVARACAFLGYNTLAQVVLGISIFGLFKTNPGIQFNLKEFWRHSLAVAVGAEALARLSGYNRPEECFTAGLLHDLGKVAMYTLSPESLMNTSHFAIQNKKTFFEAELELGDVRHTILGGLLAQKWRLPLILATAIRTHHLNPEDRNKQLGELSVPVTFVSLADKIAHNHSIGFSGDIKNRTTDAEEMEITGLSEEKIEDALPAILKGVDNAKEFLKFV